jgi:hypothetical protein
MQNLNNQKNIGILKFEESQIDPNREIFKQINKVTLAYNPSEISGMCQNKH